MKKQKIIKIFTNLYLATGTTTITKKIQQRINADANFLEKYSKNYSDIPLIYENLHFYNQKINKKARSLLLLIHLELRQWLKTDGNSFEGYPYLKKYYNGNKLLKLKKSTVDSSQKTAEKIVTSIFLTLNKKKKELKKLTEANVEGNKKFICPIRRNYPIDPVQIPEDDNIYERAEIESYIRFHGKNMFTDKPVKLSDIQPVERETFQKIEVLRVGYSFTELLRALSAEEALNLISDPLAFNLFLERTKPDLTDADLLTLAQTAGLAATDPQEPVELYKGILKTCPTHFTQTLLAKMANIEILENLTLEDPEFLKAHLLDTKKWSSKNRKLFINQIAKLLYKGEILQTIPLYFYQNPADYDLLAYEHKVQLAEISYPFFYASVNAKINPEIIADLNKNQHFLHLISDRLFDSFKNQGLERKIDYKNNFAEKTRHRFKQKLQNRLWKKRIDEQHLQTQRKLNIKIREKSKRNISDIKNRLGILSENEQKLLKHLLQRNFILHHGTDSLDKIQESGALLSSVHRKRFQDKRFVQSSYTPSENGNDDTVFWGWEDVIGYAQNDSRIKLDFCD